MPDDNLDVPLSCVDFYAQIGSGATAELRFVGSVAESAATTELAGTAGTDARREWSYKLTVSAAAYEDIAGDGRNSIVAIGVSTEDGGAVAMSAVSAPFDVDAP